MLLIINLINHNQPLKLQTKKVNVFYENVLSKEKIAKSKQNQEEIFESRINAVIKVDTN
jgi:hypothetical protein